MFIVALLFSVANEPLPIAPAASPQPSWTCPVNMQATAAGCVYIEGLCDPVLDFGCVTPSRDSNSAK